MLSRVSEWVLSGFVSSCGRYSDSRTNRNPVFPEKHSVMIFMNLIELRWAVHHGCSGGWMRHGPIQAHLQVGPVGSTGQNLEVITPTAQ